MSVGINSSLLKMSRHLVFVSGFSSNHYIGAAKVTPPNDDNSRSYIMSFNDASYERKDK